METITVFGSKEDLEKLQGLLNYKPSNPKPCKECKKIHTTKSFLQKVLSQYKSN